MAEVGQIFEYLNELAPVELKICLLYTSDAADE